MARNKISTLFCDVGGVLLTNGWGRDIRAKAAAHFNLDAKDFESRHQLCFYLYEIGKIDLKGYLQMTVFYQPRSFTYEDFVEFMFAQAEPYPEMIDYVKSLKDKYHLQIVILSNEGRELTERRIKMYHLKEFVDVFVVSAFVQLRKPDREIFRMAMDLVQASPKEIIYIDDRQPFIEIASGLGIHSIKHVNLSSTKAGIEALLK